MIFKYNIWRSNFPTFSYIWWQYLWKNCRIKWSLFKIGFLISPLIYLFFLYQIVWAYSEKSTKEPFVLPTYFSFWKISIFLCKLYSSIILYSRLHLLAQRPWISFFTSNLSGHIFIKRKKEEKTNILRAAKEEKFGEHSFHIYSIGPTIYVEKILIYLEYVARIRNCLFIECFREFIKYLGNGGKVHCFQLSDYIQWKNV